MVLERGKSSFGKGHGAQTPNRCRSVTISALETLSAGMACWGVPEAQLFLEVRPHILKLNMGLQE